MKSLRNHWYIFLIVISLGAGLAWWKWPRPEVYREYIVTREPLKVTLSVSGNLTADRKADLSFQTGGRLAWVGVQEGDTVKKWQAIANLDQRTLQKTIEKELNDYLKTRWDFQTTRESSNVLADNLDAYTLSPTTRRVLEKSQFDLNNAVLDVEIQAVSKDFSTIVTPFDGVVSSLGLPNPGVNVSPSSQVATVIDPNSLYFQAQVDELDLAKVALGAQVELTLDAYPDDPIADEVASIGFSPVTLSGGGTGYNIRIGIPGQTPDLKYKFGMNGTAVITVKEIGETLTLPINAITQKEGSSFVLIRDQSGTAQERRISTGLESSDLIEIKEGVFEGEKVVVRVKK